MTAGNTHIVFAKSDSVMLATHLISMLIERGCSKIVLNLQQDYENVTDVYVHMKIK